MIISIMQPYFFPYIGYFQLMAHSDVFVFHDDVQHIKSGWVNRNRILRNGMPCWLTFPVRAAPSNLPIDRRYYQHEPAVVARLLRRIAGAYRKAPCFSTTFPLIEQLLHFHETNVATFNVNALVRLADLLGIQTPFVRASYVEKDPSLTGEARVIEICQRLGAHRYVNPIGGTRLYSAQRFAEAGITLSFLYPALPTYPQFGQPSIPDLSIIDVLMFNDARTVAQLLPACRILSASEAKALTAGAAWRHSRPVEQPTRAFRGHRQLQRYGRVFRE